MKQNKVIICNCGGDKPNHLVGSEISELNLNECNHLLSKNKQS